MLGFMVFGKIGNEKSDCENYKEISGYPSRGDYSYCIINLKSKKEMI